MKNEQRAFSVKADKRLNIIKVQVGIAETLSNGSEPSQTAIKTYWAKIDTGANTSCISDNVIQALELEAVRLIEVQTNQGTQRKNQYIVDIYLPNRIRFTPINAMGIMTNTESGYDCIIGMDILSNTDISISYANNETLFSLRIPASGGIDFVQMIDQQKNAKTPKRTVAATRDQPCPCGSGKKHKNCCSQL